MLATRSRGTAAVEADRRRWSAIVSLFVLEADDVVIARGQDYLYTTAVAVKLIVLVLVLVF